MLLFPTQERGDKTRKEEAAWCLLFCAPSQIFMEHRHLCKDPPEARDVELPNDKEKEKTKE